MTTSAFHDASLTHFAAVHCFSFTDHLLYVARQGMVIYLVQPTHNYTQLSNAYRRAYCTVQCTVLCTVYCTVHCVMCCTVLYCVVLCFCAVYCVVLCCTVLYCAL